MKIELNETDIAQAIVEWLAQNSVLKNNGPYDVEFDWAGGAVIAIVKQGDKTLLIDTQISNAEQC